MYGVNNRKYDQYLNQKIYIIRVNKEKNLVQLCKAKLLNILNDDGVCILNVKPTFNYICTDKDFYFT